MNRRSTVALFVFAIVIERMTMASYFNVCVLEAEIIGIAGTAKNIGSEAVVPIWFRVIDLRGCPAEGLLIDMRRTYVIELPESQYQGSLHRPGEKVSITRTKFRRGVNSSVEYGWMGLGNYRWDE